MSSFDSGEVEGSSGLAWYFGYGSLIWRPGFEYQNRMRAVLRGFGRRFWQGSPDHRGTVETPGRVVTLIPSVDEDCSGVAYWVDPDRDAEVLAYLDHRESGGYSREIAPITLEDGRSVDAIVYVGREDNPSYLGPAPLKSMARQIGRSSGPSGSNLDYLRELSEALKVLNVDDPHVTDLLEQAVKFGTQTE